MIYDQPPSGEERSLAASERARVLARGRQLRRRKAIIGLSVVAAGLSVAMVAALDSGKRPSSVQIMSPSTPATLSIPPSTLAPSTDVTEPNSSQTLFGTLPPARTTVSVPVVVCPTSLASTPPTTAAPPHAIPLAVPKHFAGLVAIYTDTLVKTKIVAPTGWSCSALYGEDGSGSLAVYPSSQTDPLAPNSSLHHVLKSSKIAAIIGGTSGACADCALLQACPLFPEARRYQSQVGYDGCVKLTKPPKEATQRIMNGVVAFLDPPGAPGTGSPSGGEYPAMGVMTYHPSSNFGSWTETCTLPPEDSAVCTLSLDQFTASYSSL